MRNARWAWMLAGLTALAGSDAGASAEEDLPPLPPANPAPAARPVDPAASVSQPPAPAAPPPATTAGSGPAGPDDTSGPRPNFLRRLVETPAEPAPPPPSFTSRVGRFFRTPVDPPNGFSGRSSIIPREPQTSDDFVPMEDRWRIGFPFWDRYGRGHAIGDDYPYVAGRSSDPFNQNVLKGDYPFSGSHKFMEMTAASVTLLEGRTVPTPTTPFEATERPIQPNFFGRPGQFLFQQNFIYSLDVNHGDAGFKPTDWRIRLTPIMNLNNFALQELGNVNPNVLQGVSRFRTWFTLQEWFLESKIADISPDYDFVSLRLGSQPFVSDFRAFLFGDVNRAARIFGTRNANRDQFNLAYFSQQEKDTNSFLNTFNNRNQNLIFANYYRQDFLFPGYTAQVSVNYDNDQPTVKFDKNRNLVRPDPVGVVRPHQLNVAYLGWAGDGHIGRFNITHQFYWALGRDSLNPLANRAQNVDAQFFAIEGSYDRDWARFRTSFLYSSGDGNVNNTHATGFDTILNNFQFQNGTQFAGGTFSYFQHQNLPLFGVNLTNRGSLIPDLRSSQIQGQANYVNPGLLLINFGVDFDLTPRLRMINNLNLLWFDKTNSLEQFLYDGHIDRYIGEDLSVGFEYRPLVSENIVFLAGAATLLPGQGLRDLYNNFSNRTHPFAQLFSFITFTY